MSRFIAGIITVNRVNIRFASSREARVILIKISEFEVSTAGLFENNFDERI